MYRKRVFLLDQFEVVRRGMRALLEPAYEVVGECGILECMPLIEKARPDILIMEFMVTDLDGTEIIRQVHKALPNTHILVLSSCDDEMKVKRCLRYGALGYALKESDGKSLLGAVRMVADGHRYLSKTLQDRAIQVYARQSEEQAHEPCDSLSPREREVFYMVAGGATTRDIAQQVRARWKAIAPALCVNST